MTRAGGGPWGTLENARPAEHSNMQITKKGAPLVDEDGNVTVFWANQDPGPNATSTIWSRTKPALSPLWLPAEPVVTGASWMPVIVPSLDDEGRMYVFFNKPVGEGVYLTVRDRDTGLWSETDAPPRVPVGQPKALPGGRLVALTQTLAAFPASCSRSNATTTAPGLKPSWPSRTAVSGISTLPWARTATPRRSGGGPACRRRTWPACGWRAARPAAPGSPPS